MNLQNNSGHNFIYPYTTLSNIKMISSTCRGLFAVNSYTSVADSNNLISIYVKQCATAGECISVQAYHKSNSIATGIIINSLLHKTQNQATGYASQHIWCLTQARINWMGCNRKGIQRKNAGNEGGESLISLDGVAPS